MPDTEKLYISKVTLPSGNIYYVKDEEAREQLETLSKYTKFLGVTTTELEDGITTNPITINEESVTAENGNIVIYESKEFIFNGTAWAEFGDLSGLVDELGNFAYIDSISSTYTPSGTITAPSFTGKSVDVTISSQVSGDISATFTGSESTIVVKGEVASQDIVISGTAGTATYTPEGEITAPAFTGDDVNISIDYTPAGTITNTSFEGTTGDVNVSGTPNGSVTIPTVSESLTGNYTPSGTISTPSINVTAPSASAVYQLTNGQTPTFTASLLTASVGNDENLVFSLVDNGFNAGAMPTFSSVNVVTSVNAALATAPSFTGTTVDISAAFVGSDTQFAGTFKPSGTVAASFTGTSSTLTSTITTSGSVAAPTFNGSGVRLVGTFASTSATFSGSYTPEGDVTGTFTSTFASTSTITPSGSVTAPTFTGTESTITLTAPTHGE